MKTTIQKTNGETTDETNEISIDSERELLDQKAPELDKDSKGDHKKKRRLWLAILTGAAPKEW